MVEEKLTKEDISKYSNSYSEDGLFNKVSKNVQSIGANIVYNALNLYYATENPACPTKVKAGIYAALGYLIVPLDIIPDFAPIMGYSDDAAGIAASIGIAQMYIDDDVKLKSRKKMASIFGDSILKKI